MTSVSLGLINYTNMTAANIQQFINTLKTQGVTELTLNPYAQSDFSDGVPNPSMVATSKNIIALAKPAGIAVNMTIHTWYTTWDNYFRDTAPNSASNRAKYITYVKNFISAFAGYDIKSWMVLNEPQARKATASENAFIQNVYNAAKTMTSAPVAIRYMGGYSPSTGHYTVDGDFLCRNVYWDPRSPTVNRYGITNVTMDQMIADAKAKGKQLWITEFGRVKTDTADQAAYVKSFVEYSKTKGVDKVFCWVAQPSQAGENYNIFNGYTPLPAFYELKNDVVPPEPPIPPSDCQEYIDMIAKLNEDVEEYKALIEALNNELVASMKLLSVEKIKSASLQARIDSAIQVLTA